MKASMKILIFHDWLRRFDSYISRTPNRNLALLIENCNAHGTLEKLPSLQSVYVFFLQPNTTFKIQPMGAGAIDSLKLRYITFQIDRALDCIDEIEKSRNVYKVDVITAMRELTRICKYFLVKSHKTSRYTRRYALFMTDW